MASPSSPPSTATRFERDAEEEVDGWVAVRTPDGHEGWASEEFLLR